MGELIVHTSGKVGADGLAGDRPIGGIHRNCVGGTGQEVGQQVLLVDSIHKNCFSCNYKSKEVTQDGSPKCVYGYDLMTKRTYTGETPLAIVWQLSCSGSVWSERWSYFSHRPHICLMLSFCSVVGFMEFPSQ